jgi:predicted DNA-binding helix-hairpin-helix protein
MDTEQKLNLLVRDARYDACSTCPSNPRSAINDVSRSITTILRSDGQPMPVLKILQTNACARDCFYCPFRAGRDFRRVAFKPEELAQAFDQLTRARLVEGLFLSSGIVGRGEHSQEQIVATAEIVRQKYDFRGYIHLKLMPNASPAAIERAMQLANRVSVNLEAPNADRLVRLTGTKDFDAGLLGPLRVARQLADRPGLQVSRTTQLVVGAAGESDQEILERSSQVYQELALSRVYYSAFHPVPDTPLENLPATPPIREHRLYQADFLLRQYGFSVDELGFDADGNLPADVDPKTAWALRHRDRFPLDVNQASREELLRVPGIGPRSAERILSQRRRGRLRSPADLSALGVQVRRASPFVLLDGPRPPVQLPLWA